jgi:hypothetical protein
MRLLEQAGESQSQSFSVAALRWCGSTSITTSIVLLNGTSRGTAIPVNFVTVVALVGCKDSVSAELGSYGWGVDACQVCEGVTIEAGCAGELRQAGEASFGALLAACGVGVVGLGTRGSSGLWEGE